MLEWLSIAVAVVRNSIAVNANDAVMNRRFFSEHQLLTEGKAVLVAIKIPFDGDFIETLFNAPNESKAVQRLVGKSIRGAATMAPINNNYFTLYFVAQSEYQFMAMINGLSDEELSIEAHIAYKRTILLTK